MSAWHLAEIYVRPSLVSFRRKSGRFAAGLQQPPSSTFECLKIGTGQRLLRPLRLRRKSEVGKFSVAGPTYIPSESTVTRMIEGDNGRSEGVGKGGSAPPLPHPIGPAAAGALPARRNSALGSPYTSIDIFPRLSPGCSTISSMSVRKIGAAPVLMSGSL
jgi:hypothetical protein